MLDRRAAHYGADRYIGAGELSDTHAHDLATSAAEDGRILVCFTVCDFDPSGRQTTTSIARKLRAFKTLLFPKLEYRVREIGLTLQQAIDFLALCRVAHDEPGLKSIGGVLVRPIGNSLH